MNAIAKRLQKSILFLKKHTVFEYVFLQVDRSILDKDRAKKDRGN